MSNDIVITGLGVISAFGTGYETFWNNLIDGKSGIKKITKFNTDNYVSKLGAEIKEFYPQKIVKDSRIDRMSFFMQLSVCSADIALTNGKFKVTKDNAKKIGIFFGTENADIANTQKVYDGIIEKGPGAVDPLLFSEAVFNAPASMISIRCGIKGPIVALPSGFISGAYALIQAVDYLERGIIDYALVGATEINAEILHKAYSDLKLLSPLQNKKHVEASKPFDSKRNGIVNGEGSVFMLLEKTNTAREREANIYGKVLSYGWSKEKNVYSCDGDGIGLTKSMQSAMDKANVNQEIDYILACALSHPLIDKAESIAVKTVFGEKAYDIPITSIKGSIGFTYSCDALFNVVAGVMALKHKKLPSTLNYTSGDEDCDLDYIPTNYRQKEIKNFLVNAFSWGGMYASILIGESC